MDWDELYRWLSGEALQLEELPGVKEALMDNPSQHNEWWHDALEPSEAETAELGAGARSFAAGKPPPMMSPMQTGRLALRIRMAGRLARVLGSRTPNRPTGWFPKTLGELSQRERLEWLLLEGWEICSQILDESLEWCCELPMPEAPRPDVPPSPPAEADSGDKDHFGA